MTLYRNPTEHAANPPETWTVSKACERSWRLVDRQGTVIECQFPRKRDAEQAKINGFCARLYEKESRWYAGESVSGWKPYQPTS